MTQPLLASPSLTTKPGFHLNGAWCSPIDLAPNFAATMMGLSGLCSYSVARLNNRGFSILRYSKIIVIACTPKKRQLKKKFFPTDYN